MSTIRPKTDQELDSMREGGKRLNAILTEVVPMITTGKSLAEIDKIIAKAIARHQAKPSFLNYQDYPAHSCLSVNDVVVHGIPTDYKLHDGDIIGVDIGILFEDHHTDAAITIPVGTISEQDAKLLAVTQEALRVGVAAAIRGNTVGDIGTAIENYVDSQGNYGIIRDLTGHGVGLALQEAPEIPNYRNDSKVGLVNNMTLAIEPMIALGDWRVVIDSDGWGVHTKDKSRSAHFETTVVIHDNEAEVLVALPLQPLFWQKELT